jgi:hypothetical protein
MFASKLDGLIATAPIVRQVGTPKNRRCRVVNLGSWGDQSKRSVLACVVIGLVGEVRAAAGRDIAGPPPDDISLRGHRVARPTGDAVEPLGPGPAARSRKCREEGTMESTPRRRTRNGTTHLTLRFVDDDPTVVPGTLIVVDWHDRRPVHGRCYLVRNCGKARLARYCRSTDGFLANDGDRTPFAGPVDIVGRVVSVARSL